jgi:3-hydroxyisobutyrate dehydrogenase-like beta-hydroxyacid dehydrogenase
VLNLQRIFSGVIGAKAGTLSFLVGGSKESFSRASPILALMGQRMIHCGPAGSGLAAKICNNLMLGVEQIVVAEAMLLGQRLGLDPAVLASVINNSTGACWSSSVNNPVPGALPEKSPPCERDFEGGFATELMIKVSDVKCLPWSSQMHSITALLLCWGYDRTWDWQGTYREHRVQHCRWQRQPKGFMWRQ